MPIFQLEKNILFPAPEFAEENGLLAIGGDLTPERMIYAYERGIFPWYGEKDPILWWSPDPRALIDSGSLKISKSLDRILKKGNYEIRIDSDFETVVRHCSEVSRKDQPEGSWIHEEMIRAYLELFRVGIAHSIETYYAGELAGGLFGICLGRCFIGESMFHLQSDASKIALVTLNTIAKNEGLEMVDCQIMNPFLAQMGAYSIPREEYLIRLKKSVFVSSPISDWSNLITDNFPSYQTRAFPLKPCKTNSHRNKLAKESES